MSLVGALNKIGIYVGGGNVEIKHTLVAQAGLAINSGKGKIFYVSSTSGANTNNGKSPTQPLATIDAAVGKCLANRGDIIVVMQAHAENIVTATSLVCDIAGITIVGLGTGSLRPKLSFTAAAGSIVVSAANVTFKNIVFEAAYADVAEAFTPTAKYLTIEDCDFQDNAVDQNFVELVDTSTTDNQVDGLAFLNCSWISPDLSTTAMINLDAACNKIRIIGCYVNLGVNVGNLPALLYVATGKSFTNIDISHNVVVRLNTANTVLFDGDTTTGLTGRCHHNQVLHADTSGEALGTSSLVAFAENYASGVVNTSGYRLPAADS